MAGIVFKRLDNLRGLYLTHDATPRTARFIYINSGGKPEPEIGLKEAWNGTVSDAYCFVPFLPKDPQRLWRRVIALPFIHRDGHVLLWISDPDTLKQIQPLKIGNGRQPYITQDDNDYLLRNSTLRIPRGCKMEVNDAQNSLTISSRDGYAPRLLRDAAAANGTPGALDVPLATVELPLTVDGQGSLQFDVALDEDNLDALDVGLRYFYRGVDAGNPVRAQRYPVFNPGRQGKVWLRAYLDRYAPADVTRTYYAFQRDDSGRIPVLGSYFRTHLGHALGLIPEIDTPASTSGHPRLVFVDMPATAKAGDPDHQYDDVYLAPAGDFRLQVARPGAAKLMCGLSATEAIGLVSAPAGGASTNLLSFHPNQPAYAPNFPITPNGAADSLLDGTYATSYVLLRSESTPRPPPALDIYGQPESAPLFYRPADSPIDREFLVFFDTVAGALPPGRPTRGVPLVPYAGLMRGGSTGQSGIADATGFECQVLNPLRRLIIDELITAPTGAEPGAVNKTTTPQGLLVQVDGGSWKKLILAAGDDPPAVSLMFENLNEQFQRALQRDQIFLVASLSTAETMGTFSSGASIGGWKFNLDLGMEPDSPEDAADVLPPVLIFKFFNDSFVNLAQQAERWTSPEHFIGGQKAQARLQRQLNRFLADAKQKDDPALQSFKELIENPHWNGVIALRCRIDGAGMPPELQGLLAGIDPSKFCAHHFGIDINQVGADLDIRNSSLFALINYESDCAKAPDHSADESRYDFCVRRLKVGFANSAVTDFACRLRVTARQFFDADVKPGATAADAQADPYSIEFDGSYESHDGTVTYTFLAELDKEFQLDSEVITKIVLEKVQLSTLDAKQSTHAPKDPNARDITTKIGFWGTLEFGRLTDFDLFAFERLAFADLALKFPFTLKGDNRIDLHPPEFHPGDIRFDVSVSKKRQEALLKNFPIRLTGFSFDTRGIRPAESGFFPLDVPGIEPADRARFALMLQLDFGSSGGLGSKVKGLDCDVLLGWDPAQKGKLAFGIKLPPSTGNRREIGIQGVLLIRFRDFMFKKLKLADQDRPRYVLLLSDFQLAFLGKQLPPGGSFSTLLFVDPHGTGAGDQSNLGWFLAYRKDADAGRRLAMRAGTTGNGGEKEGSRFDLEYLAIGQRVGLGEFETDPPNVTEVIAAMQGLLNLPIKENQLPDEKKLTEALAKIYRPENQWLAGFEATLFEIVRLTVVFSDDQPSLYGLRLALSGGKLEGLDFQILYKKISDDLGVYHIELTLPDQIRQMEFGAVTVTIPVVKIDIFTNGNFKFDMGFPANFDFSASFDVQAFPFTGAGGFYFALLDGAASPNLPPILADPPGRFAPVLEFGLGLRLGYGKDIQKGIFHVGLTITFNGILQGTLAYYRKPGDSTPLEFGSPPDFYLVRGQFALIAEMHGVVDFGIVKAAVNVRLWAAVAVRIEAYQPLVLAVEAGVSIDITITIGSFKIFGHTITISVSFSFQAQIAYSWVIGAHSPAPWQKGVTVRSSALRQSLPATDPLKWHPFEIDPGPQPELTIYFSPQVTAAAPRGSKTVLNALLLYIETGDPFAHLVQTLLRWSVNQYLNPGATAYAGKLDIDAGQLEALGDCLSRPVTLANRRDNTVPLTYANLAEFLRLNFNVTVQLIPEGDPEQELALAVFPMIPDVLAQTHNQQGEEIARAFWDYNRRPESYQRDVAEYFHKLLANFSPPPKAPAGARADVRPPSMATYVFEDYFALIVKAGVEELRRTFEGEVPQDLEVLLKSDTFTVRLPQIAAMSSRFLLHGLRLPDNFPSQPIATLPLYDLTGQQLPLQPKDDKPYDISLKKRPPSSGPEADRWVDWFAFASDSLAIELKPEERRNIPQLLAALDVLDQPDHSPVMPINGTPSQLPVLGSRMKAFGLKNSIAWQATTADTPAVRHILPFPAPLTRQLSRGGLNLQLVAGDPPAAQSGRRGAAPHYAWGTKVDLSIRRIPESTPGATEEKKSTDEDGVYLPETFVIGGADEPGRNALEAILDPAGQTPRTIRRIEILCPVDPDNPSAGLRSDVVDPADALLIKTNFSTQSNPRLEPVKRRAVAPETAGLTTATLEDPTAFLRLIWECSIVNSGGYFLFYRDTAGGSFDNLFGAGRETVPISLVVFFENGNGDARLLTESLLEAPSAVPETYRLVPPGVNVAAVDADGPEDNPAFYAQVIDPAGDPDGQPELYDFQPAMAPGSVGYLVQRLDPEALYTLPDGSPRSGSQRRSQVIEYLTKEKQLARNGPAFAEALKQAGEVELQLANLYNLLSCRIVGDGVFGQSDHGLPVGPVEDHGDALKNQIAPTDQAQNVWCFRQVISYLDYYRGEKPPTIGEMPARSPYVAMGEQITLQFGYRDLFGNQLNSRFQKAFDLRYFDPLVAFSEWPGVSTYYRCTPDNDAAGTLTVTLIFDKQRFEATGAASDEEKRGPQIEAALDAYERVWHQISDPRVTIDLTTSLVSERIAVDKSRLTGFVQEITTFLLSVKNGQRASDARGVLNLRFSLPKTAGPDEDLFPLTAALGLHRTRSIGSKTLIDADTLRKSPAVGDVWTTVPPLSGSAGANAGTGRQAEDETLLQFVRDFEKAFPNLKVASGVAADGGRSLWVVRLRRDGAGPGIHLQFLPERARFFAPPPLANTLLTRSFDDMPVFDKETGDPAGNDTPTFANVDLDKLAREFLSALDAFLTPRYAVGARRSEPDAYRQIVAAKERIAVAIAKSASHVLDKDRDVPDEDIRQAVEALSQSLLIKLSNAYDIEAVVQIPVAISEARFPGEPGSPRLFGAVRDRSAAQRLTAAASELASAKLALSARPDSRAGGPDYTSLLTFPYQTLKQAADADAGGNAASAADVDLEYLPTFLEHAIVQEPARRKGLAPFESSSWLTFVIPPPAYPCSVPEIPVALRAYPVPPTLSRQLAVAAGADPQKLDEIKRWTYQFTCRRPNVKQDTIETRVTFNRQSQPVARAAGPDRDLFFYLARFSREYASLGRRLNAINKPDSVPDGARKAIVQLADLAKGAADSWAQWCARGRAKGEMAVGLSPSSYTYRIDESETDRIRLSIVDKQPASLPNLWPKLSIDETSWHSKQADCGDNCAVYQFPDLRCTDMLTRSFLFEGDDGVGFDVLAHENAWAGVKLYRNLILVQGRKTNPQFVYQTPAVRFANPAAPLIDHFDVLPLVVESTLADCLSRFFTELFHVDPDSPLAGERQIKLTCRYGYSIAGDTPLLQDELVASLPLLHSPEQAFDLARDWDPNRPESYVNRLANALKAWFEKHQPATDGGRFQIDLSVFAALNQSNLPVLRLRDIRIGLKKSDGGQLFSANAKSERA